MWHGFAYFALSLSLTATTAVWTDYDPEYREKIKQWRQEQEVALKANDGWLTVVGLFFLSEGENRFGSSPMNDIVLSKDSAPPEIGTFEFYDGKTVVHARPGITLTVNNEIVETATLRPAINGKAADILKVGSLTMFVHTSGNRYAIRVKNPNSQIRKGFKGRRWFPVDEKYRVTGQFIPHKEPRPLNVPNIIGDTEHYVSSGSVKFTLGEQEHQMLAVDTRNGLWFIFRDLTSGKETYSSARFLRSDVPKEGQITLDFNRAYNPPCAFNPYTTCPLPPKENRLPVRVNAGELTYGDH